MNGFEKRAVDYVAAKARERERAHLAYINKLGVDAAFLVERMLARPITLNFHPDRYSSNGRQVIENLILDGGYLGQFETGTTNGGRTAYVGGERYVWEQRLFSGAYPAEEKRRPKYGALNLLGDLDGACARFGSCYLTLNQAVLPRCTFAYGDSSSDPDILCTRDAFSGIVAALLRDVVENGRLLNRENVSLGESLRLIAEDPATQIGRNLDHSIEVHIHGEISLRDNVDALHLDSSFRGTEIERHAKALSDAFGVALFWIPERRLMIGEIDDEFRGPAMRSLARRIDRLFGGGGYINAVRIGRASRASVDSPEAWRDMGDEVALFQHFKQLWHMAAFRGRLSRGVDARADDLEVF